MSKKIKSIEVKVTFKVGLGCFKASKEVYNKLLELCENQEELRGDDIENENVLEWLNQNVKMRDAFEFNYEIEQFS